MSLKHAPSYGWPDSGLRWWNGSASQLHWNNKSPLPSRSAFATVFISRVALWVSRLLGDSPRTAPSLPKQALYSPISPTFGRFPCGPVDDYLKHPTYIDRPRSTILGGNTVCRWSFNLEDRNGNCAMGSGPREALVYRKDLDKFASMTLGKGPA